MFRTTNESFGSDAGLGPFCGLSAPAFPFSFFPSLILPTRPATAPKENEPPHPRCPVSETQSNKPTQCVDSSVIFVVLFLLSPLGPRSGRRAVSLGMAALASRWLDGVLLS